MTTPLIRSRSRAQRSAHARGIALALLALVAIGCSAGASPSQGAAKPGEAKEAKPASGEASIPIRTATVERESIPKIIEISGSLSSPEDAAIAAEVEGKLVRVDADLGDRVVKGQLLAQITPDELRYKAEQAEALSAQAEANWARVEKLGKSEMVSPQQLDDARAAVAQTRAAAALAKKKLEDTTVKAPFSGAIAKRNVSTGEYVRVGQPLFQVVALDRLRLTGEIPERYLAEVHAGDAVSTEIDAYPGRKFTGRIDRISPIVNPGSRAFTVEARIDNKDGSLKPGLFARARLSLGEIKDAIVVPESAVTSFAGVSRVFKIDGKLAREVRVDIDRHLEDGRLLLSGDALKPGDTVAVEGLGRLADGVEVSVR